MRLTAFLLTTFVLAILPPAASADDGLVRPPGLTPSETPRLGLSSDLELGLHPGARYNVPSASYPIRRSFWQLYGWRVRGYPYFGYYGHDYVPWEPIPQTVRMKVHRQALYDVPRLGLQYVYPYPNDIGLELPPDLEAPAVPAWPDPGVEAMSPAVADALALMKQGRYASAGRALAVEFRQAGASLDTHLLTAEVLVATGNYAAAAKVFRYGLEEAPSLEPLDGVDIAEHFPSREAFAEKLKALGEAATSPDATLLHAGLRLLSGDAGAMEDLGRLQDLGGPAAAAAKKLYLHFLDALFPVEEEAPEKPEEAPQKQEQAPPEEPAPAEKSDA